MDELGSGWRSLSSLNIARTNHPSVGMVGSTLLVAGGSRKVSIREQLANRTERNVPGLNDVFDESLDSIEYYNEIEERWVIASQTLNTPRHGHQTLVVSQSFCMN